MASQGCAAPSNAADTEDCLGFAPEFEDVFRGEGGFFQRIGVDAFVNGHASDAIALGHEVEGIWQWVLGLASALVKRKRTRHWACTEAHTPHTTHLSTELVHKHLQRIAPSVRWEVDRWSEVLSVLGILELNDDGGNWRSRSRHLRGQQRLGII